MIIFAHHHKVLDGIQVKMCSPIIVSDNMRFQVFCFHKCPTQVNNFLLLYKYKTPYIFITNPPFHIVEMQNMKLYELMLIKMSPIFILFNMCTTPKKFYYGLLSRYSIYASNFWELGKTFMCLLNFILISH